MINLSTIIAFVASAPPTILPTQYTAAVSTVNTDATGTVSTSLSSVWVNATAGSRRTNWTKLANTK